MCWYPEKWNKVKANSIEEPSEKSHIPLTYFELQMSPLALSLPLLQGARLLRLSPGTRLAAAPAWSAAALPAFWTDHWSLSSPLSTLDFPLLWGSLGGIFGLEGGEPDPAFDSITP